MAAKKKAGRKKKVSLSEFKAWLEGVEELQPDGWGPDAAQWQLIRDRIDCIVADAPAPIQQAPQAHAQPQRMPSGFAEAGIPAPPVAAASIPLDANGQPFQVPLAGNPAPPTNPLLNPQGGGAGGPALTKTPNLDNSDGNYQTSFE